MGKTKPNDPCYCGSGKKYKKCHQPLDRLANLRGDLSGRPEFGVKKGLVSGRATVPDSIAPPDYASTGRPRSDKSLPNKKGPEQLQRMRHACRMAREVLDIAVAAVRPGITTDEIDRIAHAAALERDCYPSPLNYLGFPKSICTSVNEVICHGIPDSRPLEDGDIVNIDVTVFTQGMHGDNSAMVLVGDVDAESRQLVSVTKDCLMAGISVVKPGAKLNEIGLAIQKIAHQHRYGVVEAFVGHGIGEYFHMEPQVPHYYDERNNFILRAGMTFTIEPMINVGAHSHILWDDNWTAVTTDGKRSAQWEHTVLVTDLGVEVLTLGAGEAQPFPG